MIRRPPSQPAPLPMVAVTAPNADSPTFLDLDQRESLFVAEYVARSGTSAAGAEAALAAGYSNGNRNAAHSMASRLLRRPAILKAIRDEVGRRLTAAAPLGVAVLESLARSARSEQVRLSAARELVDRGFGPVISRNSNLNVNTTVEDMLRALDAVEDADRATQARTINTP